MIKSSCAISRNLGLMILFVFVDDDKVKTLHWPKIDLNSLYGHLELGQLLKTSDSKDKTYYAHMDKNNADLNQDLLETLVSEAGKIDLTLKKSDLEELPPSSIHSVLKRKNTITGIYPIMGQKI